jgi:glycosyltransferase XagB
MDLHRHGGIMAAPPIGGLAVKPPFSPHSRAGPAPERRPAALPAALAFLTVHGVSPAVLLTAAAEARRQAIAPEAAVLASGTIRERFFYQCFARHLGAAFIDGEIALGAGARYPHAVHAGLAPLDGRDGRWLAAPRGQLLTHLLAKARGGEHLGALLAITTPSHLSSLVRAAATASILREASLGLANLDPSLSAKERPSPAQCTFTLAAAAATTLAYGLAPAFTLALVSLSMTCFFLASIWLRLFAGAASTTCGQAPFRARVEDRRLPVYSIVVALHREAGVVPQLVAALAARYQARNRARRSRDAARD